MFHLQPASKKELSRIGRGTAILVVLLWLVWLLLSFFTPLGFSARVVVSSVLGGCVAVFNFGALCWTVEKAAAKEDDKARKGVVQLSYQLRMLFQGVWCLLCLIVGGLQPVAGILPLIFPRIAIYYLQITGVYQSEAAQDTIRTKGKEDLSPMAAVDGAAEEDVPSDEGGEN